MVFKIHYNGDYVDEIIIEGETIEEIRELAYSEGARRGWNPGDCWSEELE